MSLIMICFKGDIPRSISTHYDRAALVEYVSNDMVSISLMKYDKRMVYEQHTGSWPTGEFYGYDLRMSVNGDGVELNDFLREGYVDG